MKRQELKALLHGVENAGEIIDQIMEINGADIENAKKEKSGGNEALNREIERLKREMEPDTDIVMMPYHTAFDEGGAPVFTYYRERLIRRAAGMRWVGAVHEVIVPQGKILYSTAAVEHHKRKPAEPGRNRRIFERMLERGDVLDARQRFYYARELCEAGETARAAAIFEQLIDRREGWTPNLIDACGQLCDCYAAQG